MLSHSLNHNVSNINQNPVLTFPNVLGFEIFNNIKVYLWSFFIDLFTDYGFWLTNITFTFITCIKSRLHSNLGHLRQHCWHSVQHSRPLGQLFSSGLQIWNWVLYFIVIGYNYTTFNKIIDLVIENLFYYHIHVKPMLCHMISV